MKIHSCIVSYNRLGLTKQVVSSYLETVSVPHSLVIVDNGSDAETVDWLVHDFDYQVILLGENRFPGYACNRGWEQAPVDANFLHRQDNDFVFLPGWCEEVERVFKSDKVGQVGLRTGDEEENGQYNVGGNNVIRRELWDKGLRYDERPWPEYPRAYTEDSYFSPAVKEMGYTWTRVKKPCVEGLERKINPDDPYYVASWKNRGIYEWARERHA